MEKTSEDLLQAQLARCADSIAKRLANSDSASSITIHDCELNAAVALLNASARLADALARLRGRTQTIHVIREGGAETNDGSNRNDK
jgi:CRP-like cAMP-binding protein